jgi:hypothetical protein
MPQSETRAWWDDVQHVRDSIERKREDEARRGLRLDARSAARAVAERAAGEANAAAGTPDAPDAGPDDWAPRRGRRFERAAPERRGRFARADREGRQRGANGEPHPDAGHPAAAPLGRPARADAGHPSEAPRPLTVPRRRRTVEITGRTVGAPALPRLVEVDRRRPARRPVERVGPRPDRLALWAVVLGFFLIFVAVTSTSHAATRAHAARAAAGRTAHSQVVRTHTATLRATPPAR